MKVALTRTLALALALTTAAASAQTDPTRDRFTVWGGLSTEFYALPGVMVGASVPVGRVGGMNLGLRGSTEAILLPAADVPGPLTFVNVDLLLSGSGRNLRAYGGPSVGTLLGFAWLLGGVGGVRGDFGGGPWGYFAEAKLRFLYGAASDGGGTVFAPGLNVGVTYRF